MKRGTPYHPKTLALAAELGLEQWGAVGVWESVIHFAASYAKCGDIGKHPDAVIAAGIGWKGDPKRLTSALLAARLLDACKCHRLRVHDWPEHADQTVSRSEEVKTRGYLKCYDDPSSVLAADYENASQPTPTPTPTPTPVAAGAAPRAARLRVATSQAPDDLDAAQRARLEELLRHNTPWLYEPGMDDTSPHCHPRWVEQQIRETLSYWRAEGKPKADWVLTVANRIYAEDGRAWQRSGQPPPIASVFHERQRSRKK